MAVVEKKNYSEFSDAGSSHFQNESGAEQTAADVSSADHFSYYTVVDTDSRFLLEFNFWIQAFLFKLVPCVLLTALTVMLIVAMHQAHVRRMKLKSQVTITMGIATSQKLGSSIPFFLYCFPSPAFPFPGTHHLRPATGSRRAHRLSAKRLRWIYEV